MAEAIGRAYVDSADALPAYNNQQCNNGNNNVIWFQKLNHEKAGPLCIMINSGDSTTMYAPILMRRWGECALSVLWVFFSLLKVRPESFVTFQKDFCFLLLPPKV